MNKVIDKGFRSSRFVSTIVKHPVHVNDQRRTCTWIWIEILRHFNILMDLDVILSRFGLELMIFF